MNREQALVAYAYGIGRQIARLERASRGVFQGNRASREYAELLAELDALEKRYSGPRRRLIQLAFARGREEESASPSPPRSRDSRSRRASRRTQRSKG